MYLKLLSFDLALDDKRALAAKLTDCVTRTLSFSEREREFCIVQFEPYRSEDVAVGGRLAHDGKNIEDGKSPFYYLEVSHHRLAGRQRKQLIRSLTRELSEHLDLQSEWQRLKVRIEFRELDPKEYAIGGVSLSSFVKNGMDFVVQKVRARLHVKLASSTTASEETRSEQVSVQDAQ